MAHAGQEIVNPRTGQRMRFIQTAADTDGTLLAIETTNAPTGDYEPVHVHPRQQSSARVLSGALRFVVDGEARDIGPGGQITIPAGVPHHFCNPGSEAAVAIQEFRPALRTAEMFETLFTLARRGELNDDGVPSLLRLSLLAPAWGDEIRVVKPPWAVQRLLFAILGPIARMRGLSACG